jgi:hypothetical protein
MTESAGIGHPNAISRRAPRLTGDVIDLMSGFSGEGAPLRDGAAGGRARGEGREAKALGAPRTLAASG